MSVQPQAGAGEPVVLADRYLLQGKIAAGGMGEVWRAVDQTLGRPVAVKLLRPEYASDDSFLVRFRGEARHAARLSHPGVASVYDYGEVRTGNARPTAYLVMELVEGEPLSALLHRERRIDAARMLDILGQSAAALQAAHAQGVVHRDVKPGNLLVRHDGVVKVTDFGIARAMDAAPLTATGIMMGTAYYVSPEQASGKTVTPASDVYSLGVVAYECLAGRRPFDDRNPIVVVLAHQQDTPPPLPADVPAPVRALVESAMEKQPSRRPASAEEFARTAMNLRQSLLWADGAGGRAGGQPLGRPDTPAGSGPNGGQGGGALMPTPSRSPSTRARTAAPVNGGQTVAPWDRDWNAPATAGPGPAAAPDTRGMMIPGFDEQGPYADDTRYAPAGNYANGPGPRAARNRPAGGRRRAGSRGSFGGALSSLGGRPRVPLPLLVALLVATVIITALVTRSLAATSSTASGSGGATVVGGRPSIAVVTLATAADTFATWHGPLPTTAGGKGEDVVTASTAWGSGTRSYGTRVADAQGAGGN